MLPETVLGTKSQIALRPLERLQDAAKSLNAATAGDLDESDDEWDESDFSTVPGLKKFLLTSFCKLPNVLQLNDERVGLAR
jgi:hypothetical protein